MKRDPVSLGSLQAYYLDFQEGVAPTDQEILFAGLNEEAVHAKGMEPIRSFGILVRTEEGEIRGGLTGCTLFGCLHVDTLWLDESLRGQGWGTELMSMAETFGKQHECIFATVNTMDWQALPFYEKLGYSIEFIRRGYANDSKMFLLRKTL